MVFVRNFDLSRTSICRHRAKIPLILRLVRLRVLLGLELLARYLMKIEERNFYEFCNFMHILKRSKVFVRNFDLSRTSICRHRAKIPLILRFVRLRVFLELELLARYPMKLLQHIFMNFAFHAHLKTIHGICA